PDWKPGQEICPALAAPAAIVGGAARTRVADMDVWYGISMESGGQAASRDDRVRGRGGRRCPRRGKRPAAHLVGLLRLYAPEIPAQRDLRWQLQLLPRDVHEQPPREAGLEHRLSRRRHQFQRARLRADEGAREVRQ